MKLKIDKYIDTGNYDKERIAFKADIDCNLKFFVVHLTHIMESGGFYNKPKETFWFAPKEIKAGDWVVLYTKKGTASKKDNDSGSTSHFYYWDLEKPIFNNENDGIVLAEVETWETKWNKK